LATSGLDSYYSEGQFPFLEFLAGVSAPLLELYVDVARPLPNVQLL
jgi:hypothetical protein